MLKRIKSKLGIEALKKKYTNQEIFTEKLNINFMIYEVILDFSFLPCVLIATLVYWSLRGESALLLDSSLNISYLVMFFEYALVSILMISKKFYFTKILLFAVCVQMIISAFIGNYVNSYNRIFIVVIFGIAISLINIMALYGWREILNYKKRIEG